MEARVGQWRAIGCDEQVRPFEEGGVCGDELYLHGPVAERRRATSAAPPRPAATSCFAPVSIDEGKTRTSLDGHPHGMAAAGPAAPAASGRCPGVLFDGLRVEDFRLPFRYL